MFSVFCCFLFVICRVKKVGLVVLVIIPWSAGKLVQLSSIGEDDECNLGITKDGKLVGFLQKSVPSFCKGHLSVDFVLNSLQLHSSSTHFFFLSFSLTQLTKPNQIIHFSFYRKFNSYFGSVCQCALCFSIYTISVCVGYLSFVAYLIRDK